MSGTLSPLSWLWPDQLGGGHDKYQRTLGDVLLPDGTNVNHTLVEDGWCWWYRKYAPGDTVLEGLESEAREARKGLWADPQPVPPWECGGNEWGDGEKAGEAPHYRHRQLFNDREGHTERMSSTHPQYDACLLKRRGKELKRFQKELIASVHPQNRCERNRVCDDRSDRYNTSKDTSFVLIVPARSARVMRTRCFPGGILASFT
jgi:hypothetical protein